MFPKQPKKILILSGGLKQYINSPVMLLKFPQITHIENKILIDNSDF